MRASRIAIACAAVFGATLLFSGAGAQAQSPAAVEKGAKIYVTLKCSTCHSIDGKGAKKGPLDGVGSKLTEAEIREWIVDAPAMTKKTKAERKPVMKSYKMSKDDLDALVAYMASLKKS